MDNEKLLKERNEKLALWAGFKPCKCGVCKSFLKEFGTQPFYNHGNEKELDLPDFEKVDNCIKWLLPKIKKLEQFSATILHRGYSINLFWTLELCLCPKETDHIFLTGDTLAEAIEKYVVWEKELGNG